MWRLFDSWRRMSDTTTKRRPKRIYSDSDKAAALVALDTNEGNVAKTARQLGIPRVTLLAWSKPDGVSDEVSDIQHTKKGDLAARFLDIIYQMVEVIPDKIPDADIRSLITGVGILTDKYQLLTGGATENVNLRAVTLTELMQGGGDASDGK
jgi:transposase-like protein